MDTSALRGPVKHRGPRHLALDGFGTAKVLAEEYFLLDPDAATTVHRLTQGWPLVHVAADALAQRPNADLPDALSRPGAAAAKWVQATVSRHYPSLPARSSVSSQTSVR